jgi:hypothetical protein
MAKKFNSVWPPPVYVGLFADGETVRMSFSTRAGKPLDYERGRNVCCWAMGEERRRREQYVPPQARPGYFESVEYRNVLRHYAQRLIDDVAGKRCLEWRNEAIYGSYHTSKFRSSGGKIPDIRCRLARIYTRHLPLFRTKLPQPQPATDIVDGWVEKGDETFPDPLFAPQPSAEIIDLPRKRKVQSDLDRALALLAKLSAGDRAILAERIAA